MKQIFILSLLSWSVAISATTVHLIGQNSDGDEVVYQADSKLLTKEFLAMSAQKNQTALKALEQVYEKSSFKLTKFSLGLGLEGEAGIGPWNLGLVIKHRVLFAKEK